MEGEDPALLDDYLGGDGVAFVEWPAAASSASAARRSRCASSTPARSAARSRSSAEAVSGAFVTLRTAPHPPTSEGVTDATLKVHEYAQSRQEGFDG